MGIVVVGEDHTGGMLNPGMVVLGGFGCFGVVDPDIQYNLNLNLNLYVAGPFSVDATGESWDE